MYSDAGDDVDAVDDSDVDEDALGECMLAKRGLVESANRQFGAFCSSDTFNPAQLGANGLDGDVSPQRCTLSIILLIEASFKVLPWHFRRTTGWRANYYGFQWQNE